MQKAYISAGSNIGDRKGNLETAMVLLAKQNAVTKVSSYFETEPVGYLDQPWFLNIVAEIATALSPLDLLNVCKSIEESCGRIRTFRNAPRTLDLDILFYGDLVISEEDLTIPHPRLAQRRFVLAPLAEIAPDLVHPVLKKSVKLLLESCRDTSQAKIFRN